MQNQIKKVKGKPVTLTFSPYIQGQLERLTEKKQISKSAVVTLAIEKYAREELGDVGK